MQPIKAILFDKDGTLFDFEKSWARWAHELFHQLATVDAPAESLASHAGFNISKGRFESDSVIVSGTPSDIISAIKPLLPALSEDELFEICNSTAALAIQVEVTPLSPFLTQLTNAGLTLGIATNDAVDTAKTHLRDSQVLDKFSFIAGYDSGFGVKPDCGMQLAFCEASNLEPQDVAMVGDSLHDLVSGRKAGMFTIGVLTGVTPRHTLEPHADIVLDSIASLPKTLGIA